jgi:hypothetical protein
MLFLQINLKQGLLTVSVRPGLGWRVRVLPPFEKDFGLLWVLGVGKRKWAWSVRGSLVNEKWLGLQGSLAPR